MRKIILTGLIFVMFTTFGFADTITIDTTGWTQEEKNLVHAVVEKLTFDNGITHKGIFVGLPIVEIKSPSKPIAGLTAHSIKSAIDQLKLNLQSADDLANAEAQVKKNEAEGSELRDLKLSEVDAKIDAIDNLQEAKTFLKKLVRYLAAKGLL